MSSKILLSIYLPATMSSFEMWIPGELTVHDATRLICAVVAQQEEAWFQPSSTTSLYMRASGAELDVSVLIKDLGFVNGSQLLLI